MKITLIVLGVLIAGFIGFQIYSMINTSNIETYPYNVVKTVDDVEIRNYEPSLFTSVNLSTGKYKEGSRKGFSVLADYIFGGNKDNEKIAMTSPVSMSLEDNMEMMFMVPKKYNKENLPQPNQSNIDFKEIPAKTMAAIQFGGWANDKKIEKHKNELKDILEANGINYSNSFYFFGYNAPYEIFSRRNEVVVELENQEKFQP
ncbi:SOUL family heme-binding protein [Portibacter marinus]|uniref:SOUL family heme-binding protein n=1 Tax=Portibacter marinus TaxID=2898660 RepID=UPI001F2A73C2|nr:heme-binding protein [Portibacter marinus]